MRVGAALVPYLANEKLHDLAIAALNSIQSTEHELAFCFWLNHPIPSEWRAELETYGKVFDNDRNCLSRGWNRGIDHLLREGSHYVFCPNLDIELRPDSLDNLVRFAIDCPEPLLWSMTETKDRQRLIDGPIDDLWVADPQYIAFMVDHRLFDEVGPFDEAIHGAYNEDLDMTARIVRAGHQAVRYEGALVWHLGSATIMLDPTSKARNDVQHGLNDRYFVRKWGAKPHGLYQFPFNDPSMLGFERRTYPPTW